MYWLMYMFSRNVGLICRVCNGGSCIRSDACFWSLLLLYKGGEIHTKWRDVQEATYSLTIQLSVPQVFIVPNSKIGHLLQPFGTVLQEVYQLRQFCNALYIGPLMVLYNFHTVIYRPHAVPPLLYHFHTVIFRFSFGDQSVILICTNLLYVYH